MNTLALPPKHAAGNDESSCLGTTESVSSSHIFKVATASRLAAIQPVGLTIKLENLFGTIDAVIVGKFVVSETLWIYFHLHLTTQSL